MFRTKEGPNVKRLIIRAVRPFWKMSAVIRRPIARRLDSRLNHMIAVAIRSQLLPTIQESLDSSSRTLERVERSVGAASRSAEVMAADIDLMLESVVREVSRLQVQVESLQDLVEHAVLPARNGLLLVEGSEDESVAWPAERERSKVG